MTCNSVSLGNGDMQKLIIKYQSHVITYVITITHVITNDDM